MKFATLIEKSILHFPMLLATIGFLLESMPERRAGQKRREKPSYTATALQSLPVTTVPLWEQAVLDQTQAPLRPLEGELVSPTRSFRDQLVRRGASTLSNPELLSVALQIRETAPIDTMLASYTLQELSHVDVGELCNQFKLGEAKAAQLQALLELARRFTFVPATETITITSPRDAANLLIPEMAYLDHEEMRVLLLDTKNQVKANLQMYKGTVNSSVLRAAELYRPAVARNCPGIIVAHNHPSGDPNPSAEDEAVTRQIVAVGEVLDIELVDHLVIGNHHRFVSLKERMMW